ncbi:MAG: hypothetical protein ACI9ZH_002418, partial [Paracoccaceae bacterium]
RCRLAGARFCDAMGIDAGTIGSDARYSAATRAASEPRRVRREASIAAWDGAIMTKFPPDVRARAVWMALDNPDRHGSRRKAIASVSVQIVGSAHTLNAGPKKADANRGRRACILG